MALYIHGWIECRKSNVESDGQSWMAVIDIDHLLYSIKDYDGFNYLFCKDNSPYISSLAHARGLPEDASTQVKAEHARCGPGPDHLSDIRSAHPYDFSTSTAEDYFYWRAITWEDWKKMGGHVDASQPEYRRNPQGDLVLCTWVLRVSRPTTSWISWQELKQVDWAEEVEFYHTRKVKMTRKRCLKTG